MREAHVRTVYRVLAGAALVDPLRHGAYRHSKQYLHHLKGFLIGTVGLLIVGLVIVALLNSHF